MSDDGELLRRWAEEQAEAAFAELVSRHIGLVYGVALRKVGGDAHLAQDVTQKVFADLARKARTVTAHPVLTGWLFTSTHFTACQLVRAERRRRERERRAHAMNELLREETDGFEAEKLRPILDDLMLELNERDREAVLLRFFEGRGFAELGARLRLSEDGARSRVERAVEKLQALLARRGIHSTAGALGLALAPQASAAVPAGLAATVTATATAGAPLASALVFMSMAKIGGGALVAIAALGLSISGNVYLLAREPAKVTTGQRVETKKSAVGEANAVVSSMAMKTVRLDLLRDEMRATGASESAIRAALEGILRRKYREQLSQERAARARRGWWRNHERTWGTAGSPPQPMDDVRLLREMVTRPLEQLLGPDPLRVAEAEMKYAFLPPELREKLGKLERDRPTGWSPYGVAEIDAGRMAEYDAEVADLERQRLAVVAAMTSEQRLNYEMRTSPFAANLARQLESIDVTEAEFVAVFPIADAHAKAIAAARSSQSERQSVNELTAGKLIATLGYERALDYIWRGTSEYAPYARVAREQNLAGNAAAQAVQLAAETAERAAGIHADARLNVTEKRAALVALQSEARGRFDRLIPPALQTRLPPNSLQWLDGLAAGQYRPIATVMPGYFALTMTSPSDVNDPPPTASAPKQFVPRRPSNH